MSKLIRRILGCVVLLGLMILPACESTSRTETAQSFTGQTAGARESESGQKPAPAPHRLTVKGLNGPA